MPKVLLDDHPVAELAARQHGLVTRRQLLGLGVSGSAIDRRIRGGRLHPRHRGVYAVGHARLTVEGVRLAALLACGPRSALWRFTSASVHGLRPSVTGRVEVVVGPGGRSPRDDLAMRRTTRELRTVVVDGLRCTDVAWTLADLAACLDAPSLGRALDRAEELRTFDLAAIDREIAARGCVAGVPRLRTVVLDRLAHGADVVRSALEGAFRDLVRAELGVRAIMNSRVATDIGSLEVDARLRGSTLVVELDGRAWHRSLGARARDAERDAALTRAGHPILRLSWDDVVRHPQRALDRLRRALADAAPV